VEFLAEKRQELCLSPAPRRGYMGLPDHRFLALRSCTGFGKIRGHMCAVWENYNSWELARFREILFLSFGRIQSPNVGVPHDGVQKAGNNLCLAFWAEQRTDHLSSQSESPCKPPIQKIQELMQLRKSSNVRNMTVRSNQNVRCRVKAEQRVYAAFRINIGLMGQVLW